MASLSDVVDHFKRKFYRRYIDPDLVVEPMTTSSSSQPARSSAPQSSSSSSSSSASNNQPRQRNSGAASRTSGTSTTPTSSSTSLQWNRQTIQCSVNAWVLFVAVLAIFPLVSTNLSKRAYQLAFAGTLCSSLYSLYALYGRLEFAGTASLASISYCDERFSLLHLLPYFCHFTSQLEMKFLEEACVWVESNTTTLSILFSQAEIGLGLLLVVSLFSWQRNMLQTFMYCQLLKLMYHAPATAGYHQNMWANIGRHVNPLVHRYAPFMHTPISTIQGWWLR